MVETGTEQNRGKPQGSGVSVVVPVFRSGPTLHELIERVGAALHDHPHEIILVDDGSPSATWAVVSDIAAAHPGVTGLRLGRNFGQHNALLAGTRHARYPITVTMDDDLQNPPEEIPKLLRALEEGVDVVYGTTDEQAQDRWRRASGRILRWVMAGAFSAENAAQMSSFRAFRTDLRDAFDSDIGPTVSLDALLSWGTSRFAAVDVEHHARSEGASNYTFRRLLRFAIDIATGYSTAPLQIATAIGLLTSLFGAAILGWVLIRLMMTGESVPGFPFLASTVAIFSGAQLLTLGIIGEYLARMHFRIMRKPTYVIGERADHRADEPRNDPAPGT